MDWVGRDLKDHPAPIPLSWAGMPSTSPGFSEPHPGLECFRRGGRHNFSGQPVPVYYHSMPAQKVPLQPSCRSSYNFWISGKKISSSDSLHSPSVTRIHWKRVRKETTGQYSLSETKRRTGTSFFCFNSISLITLYFFYLFLVVLSTHSFILYFCWQIRHEC